MFVCMNINIKIFIYEEICRLSDFKADEIARICNYWKGIDQRMKSYIISDKVDLVTYKGKTYIKSRPVAYRMKNVLDLNKQRILVSYFYDTDNHKVDITNSKQFEEICKKLCINRGTAIHYLRLKEILENYEVGSKKAKVTKIWRPNTIISVRAVHTITGEVVKSDTVAKLSKSIGVSETSIRKAINTGQIVKNWKIIARHKEQQ